MGEETVSRGVVVKIVIAAKPSVDDYGRYSASILRENRVRVAAQFVRTARVNVIDSELVFQSSEAFCKVSG